MLSESVAKALLLVVGDEATETAEFVSKFDSFFDILNVSNFTNGTRYLFSIPIDMKVTQG